MTSAYVFDPQIQEELNEEWSLVVIQGTRVKAAIALTMANGTPAESWDAPFTSCKERDRITQAISTRTGVDENAVKEAFGKLFGLVNIQIRQMEKEKPEKQDGSSRVPISALTEALQKSYTEKFLYDTDRGLWLRYEGRTAGGIVVPGIWTEVCDEEMYDTIRRDLAPLQKDGFSWNTLKGTENMLRAAMHTAGVAEPQGILPLRNGVLDIQKMQLLDHSPSWRLDWALPYDYDPKATCEPFIEWLSYAMDKNQDATDVILAYMKAVLQGRMDLQRFVELIGEGGTGKGTLMRTCIALVDFRNTMVTELKHLETNRFETSNLPGKRLLLISDSERFGGEVSMLKGIVGQDPVRSERKHGKQTTFFPRCLVLVAANQEIQSSDYTSGFERRRITIQFNKRPDKSESLLEFEQDKPVGKFAPILPGILNLILSIKDDDVVKRIKYTHQYAPGLRAAWAKMLTETNPLADWCDTFLVYEKGKTTYIGRLDLADEFEGTRYKNEDKWLYPNYVRHMEGTKHKPLSLTRFSSSLESFCRSQLKLDDVVRQARDENGRAFCSIRFRNKDDSLEGIIAQAMALQAKRLADDPDSGQSSQMSDTVDFDDSDDFSNTHIDREKESRDDSDTSRSFYPIDTVDFDDSDGYLNISDWSSTDNDVKKHEVEKCIGNNKTPEKSSKSSKPSGKHEFTALTQKQPVRKPENPSNRPNCCPECNSLRIELVSGRDNATSYYWCLNCGVKSPLGTPV
jgi:phage/plasmid-associated DNA primase